MSFRQNCQLGRPLNACFVASIWAATTNRLMPCAVPDLAGYCWQGSATVTTPSRRTGATKIGSEKPEFEAAACTMRSLPQ